MTCPRRPLGFYQWSGLALSVLCGACGGGDGPSNTMSTPTPAQRVTAHYEVSRGDVADRARVRFRLPGGEEVEADVSLRWRSERLVFGADEVLRLTASSGDNDRVSLQCTAVTDQGPYGRETGTGRASCMFETSIEELGRR